MVRFADQPSPRLALARVLGVRSDQAEGIVKCGDRFIEVDPMFLLIAGIFGLVPIKPHF